MKRSSISASALFLLSHALMPRHGQVAVLVQATTQEDIARFINVYSAHEEPEDILNSDGGCDDVVTQQPTTHLRGSNFCSSSSFSQLCHSDATCVDRPRGFRCECNSGYVGDGMTYCVEGEPEPEPTEPAPTTTTTTTTKPTTMTTTTTRTQYTLFSPARKLTYKEVQSTVDVFNEMEGRDIQISPEIVVELNKATEGQYTLYRQLAFVAHTIWESVAYTYVEEIAATQGSQWAKANYQDCDWATDGIQYPENPNNYYYGRGYLQLSWCANYKSYGADRAIQSNNDITDPNLFYDHPELVATKEYAMDSASWFFQDQVHNYNGQFGWTTRAINGWLECADNGDREIADKRYALFKHLADVVGMVGYSPDGC